MYILNFGSLDAHLQMDSGSDVAVRFGPFIMAREDLDLLHRRFPSLNIEKELKRIFKKLAVRKRKDLDSTILRTLVTCELDRLECKLPKKDSIL